MRGACGSPRCCTASPTTRLRADATSPIRTAFAAAADLAADEKRALASLDQGQMLALGIHPLVFFLAQFQIEHERTRS